MDYFHFMNKSAFMGVPAQPNQDLFRYRRAAFYSGLKSKVGLIAAKASALSVNMNTDGCLLASHVASRYPSTSHAPFAFSHLIPHPQCAPTLYALVRGVDTITYKPWPPTSSSHTHSFWGLIAGFYLVDRQEAQTRLPVISGLSRPIGLPVGAP